MDTHTKRLTWTFASLMLVAFALSLGNGKPILFARNDEGFHRDRGWNGNVGDDSRVYSCEEVGLCPEGERHLILKSKRPGALGRALGQGCEVRKLLKNETVLHCPESAVVPDARTERVFRVMDLTSDEQIGAIAIHDRGVKGDGVRVAILDTGIDAGHPELAGRVVVEKNFVDESGPEDIVGHGTHVSGIVAGQGVVSIPDSGEMNSVTGVAPAVELIVGKICNDQGWCTEGDILAGIEWAVSMNAKVINLSLGGGSFLDHCDGDPLAAKANWAVGQGVTVVASAGNSGGYGEGICTPACGSKVIAVGAVDREDIRPWWSSYGEAIDVSAPGVGILSSVPCTVTGSCPAAGYDWWSGTSMAAPHVTGLVALLLDEDPSLTPSAIAKIIESTAEDLGDGGFDPSYGYGRINAEEAVLSLIDADGDGSSAAKDCNDEDASVHPGAPETCNGVDDDCDGAIDNGCPPSSSSSSSSLSSSSVSSSAPDDGEGDESDSDDQDEDGEENEEEGADEEEDEDGDEDEEEEDDEGQDEEDQEDDDHDDRGWDDESRTLPPLPPNAAPPAQEHRPEVPPGQEKKGKN
jgi:hypothetical protein